MNINELTLRQQGIINDLYQLLNDIEEEQEKDEYFKNFMGEIGLNIYQIIPKIISKV